eukprot:15326228-Alexandrium_andersonii.AAC.1
MQSVNYTQVAGVPYLLPQQQDVAFVGSKQAKDAQGVLWSDRTEQDLLRAVKRHEAYRTDRGVSRRWTS